MQDATRTETKAPSVSRTASAVAVAPPVMGWVAVAALALFVRAASAADGGVVRLYPAAVVADDEVRLADVAEVEGEGKGAAGTWVIGLAPPVGGSRVIELSQIERALVAKGVNLSQWIFRGASRCAVSRPGRTLHADTQPARDRASAGVRAVRARAARAPGTQPSDAPRVDPNSLEGILRAHLSRRAASLGGELSIEFSPAVSRLLALRSPEYEFGITDRVDKPLGLVPVEVAIREGGQVRQVVPMLVQVSLKKQIVVAARSINRSQRIEADDLVLAERTFDRADEVGAGQVGPFVGQQAKRPIRRGEPLSAREIEPVPLVQRNDLVTVWVRRGAVSVRGAAKAMGTAGYGQLVTLKNEGSSQTFTATVTGPRTAEVPADVATASAAGTIEEQVQ